MVKNCLVLFAVTFLSSCSSAAPEGAGARCATDVAGQEPVDSFIAWAREQAIPLPAVGQGERPDDLSVLDALIGSASVVSLGEPAHGAHEPLAFRNRLFRYLVEQRGFTAIALETGFSESRHVQDLVAGGPGDVVQAVRDNFTWGFGNYAENVELIRWMRAYNDNPSHRVKLSFYGIDVPGGHAGTLSRARVALDDALAYVARAAPQASGPMRNEIEPLLEDFTGERFSTLPPDSRERLCDAIERLTRLFESERNRMLETSSIEEYEWARRNAAISRELSRMFRAWPADLSTGLTPDFYRAMDIRDATMADNVRFALEQEGPGGRILVFGHNAHIMNAPLRGGPWAVYEKPATPMGPHLRASLSEKLLIIGTSSAVNGPVLPEAPEQPTTLEQALGRVGAQDYLLDLRAAGGCPVAAHWLEQTQSMRTNFTVEIELAPGTAFDALVFFDRLTPAAEAPPEP